MPGLPPLQQVVERYRKLDSALLYDTLDAMGLPQQQLDLTIAPLHLDMVVACVAFVIDGRIIMKDGVLMV